MKLASMENEDHPAYHRKWRQPHHRQFCVAANQPSHHDHDLTAIVGHLPVFNLYIVFSKNQMDSQVVRRQGITKGEEDKTVEIKMRTFNSSSKEMAVFVVANAYSSKDYTAITWLSYASSVKKSLEKSHLSHLVEPSEHWYWGFQFLKIVSPELQHVLKDQIQKEKKKCMLE
ncbi:hypothetical protein L2E82_48892 [Cichorium intybus]|uniref:Uncharacterized protein n=1 Tax=Cichorium intybus TaxID=13427 RepID=A0ACB8YZA2_CICIN|nr:hypothetical protein L2E82_48892 [Cichorium intybus]